MVELESGFSPRTPIRTVTTADRTLLATTLGLRFAVTVVALLSRSAMEVTARLTGEDVDGLSAAYAPSLVPIALGYVVAHYFSLFVFEGQAALALASDPFGRGWDLFGTVDWRVD